MNKSQEKQVEEVRKEIAYIKLADDGGILVEGVPDYIKGEVDGFTLDKIEEALDFADQILSHPKIAILDDDQYCLSISSQPLDEVFTTVRKVIKEQQDGTG